MLYSSSLLMFLTSPEKCGDKYHIIIVYYWQDDGVMLTNQGRNDTLIHHDWTPGSLNPRAIPMHNNIWTISPTHLTGQSWPKSHRILWQTFVEMWKRFSYFTTLSFPHWIWEMNYMGGANTKRGIFSWILDIYYYLFLAIYLSF